MFSICYPREHSMMKVIVAPVWLDVMIEWQMLSFWDKPCKQNVCKLQVQHYESLLFLAPQWLWLLALILHAHEHTCRQTRYTVLLQIWNKTDMYSFLARRSERCSAVCCCTCFIKYLSVVLFLTSCHSRSKCDYRVNINPSRAWCYSRFSWKSCLPTNYCRSKKLFSLTCT